MYHCHLIRHCRHNDDTDKPSDFAVLHVQSNPCRWFLLHRKMLGLHIQLWCQPAPNLLEDCISNFWDWSLVTCGMCCFFSRGSVMKRLKSNLSVSDAPPFYDTNNWVELRNNWILWLRGCFCGHLRPQERASKISSGPHLTAGNPW